MHTISKWHTFSINTFQCAKSSRCQFVRSVIWPQVVGFILILILLWVAIYFVFMFITAEFSRIYKKKMNILILYPYDKDSDGSPATSSQLNSGFETNIRERHESLRRRATDSCMLLCAILAVFALLLLQSTCLKKLTLISNCLATHLCRTLFGTLGLKKLAAISLFSCCIDVSPHGPWDRLWFMLEYRR